MKASLKIFLLLMVAAFALTMSGCSENSQQADRKEGDYQKIKLVMTVNGTNIATDTRMAMKFAELVAEESNGNVTVDVFPNDQLAGGNASKGISMKHEVVEDT